MTITIKCECGKVLKVADEHAGKRGKCPACGAVLTIPSSGQEEAATAAPEPAPTPAADTPSGVERLKMLEERIPFGDAGLTPAKKLAIGLAAVPSLPDDTAKVKLAELRKDIDEQAAELGEDHSHVKILRAMDRIAAAVIKNTREPTDEERGL